MPLWEPDRSLDQADRPQRARHRVAADLPLTRLRVRRVGEAVAGLGIRGWAIATGLVAFAMRFPFLFGRHSPLPRGDEEFFLWLASRIYHDNHFPNHYFTPG